MKTLIASVCLGMAVASAATAECRIDRANYEKADLGFRVGAVDAAFGCAGRKIDDAESDRRGETLYRWRDDERDVTVYGTFRNGVMIQKLEMGLQL